MRGLGRADVFHAIPASGNVTKHAKRLFRARVSSVVAPPTSFTVLGLSLQSVLS